MPFKVPVGNKFIDCDTPEEALGLAKALGLVKSLEQVQDLALVKDEDLEEGEFLPGNRVLHHGPWTEAILDTFLHSLGRDQKEILRILVDKKRATADELRAAIGVEKNQALAGVISGISKQAVALGIKPRDVFGIENNRKSGVLNKSFVINEDLLKIAQFANWPPPSEQKAHQSLNNT
jgi:hypothetical protein